MATFDLVIDRILSCSQSIVGKLYANGSFICYTLELAWFWNMNFKSCVPLGKYPGFLRYDKPDGWRIQLLQVPGDREGVQIHIGNYPRDIEGCVLVGTSYSPDVVWNSAAAYSLLHAAYNQSTGKQIQVEFKGILATPWGDYPGSTTGTLA